METKIIHITSDHDIDLIKEAAMTLKIGGLVAFPTETVYGIGANALDEAIVKKIYEAKCRPSDNPLIVHVGDAEDVEKYVKTISIEAKALMDAFWPGPLTLIFDKNELIPEGITGGLSTVAIRVPAHPIARAIIKASGLPIAAPSANTSGKPSPTIAAHVIEDLDGRVDMIVDGGDATIGLESTVLDLTSNTPMILRPGGITKKMIESVIGPIGIDPHMLGTTEMGVPKSPGMKYRHYAPKGKLTVFNGENHHIISEINKLVSIDLASGHRVGVIATKEDALAYECPTVMIIGSEHNPDEIASNLFKVIRSMDELGVEHIYTKAFHEKEIGVATMNRLLKAAGNEQRWV